MPSAVEGKGRTSELVDNLFLYASDIALLFKRAEATIRDWAARCKARRKKDGSKVRYYLPDIFEYYETEIAPSLKGQTEDLEKVKAELEKVKLEKEKLNLAVLKGEYVRKEQVEIEWAQRASELRQGLIALEYRLASRLANKRMSISKVREIIKKEVLALLEAYTEEGEYTPPLKGISHEEFEKHYFEFLRKLERGELRNGKKAKLNRKRKKSTESA